MKPPFLMMALLSIWITEGLKLLQATIVSPLEVPNNTDPTMIQPSNIVCDCFGSCGPASTSPRPKRCATRKRKAPQHPDEPAKKKTVVKNDSSAASHTTTACISVVSNFVKYLNEGVVEKYLGAVPSGTPKE